MFLSASTSGTSAAISSVFTMRLSVRQAFSGQLEHPRRVRWPSRSRWQRASVFVPCALRMSGRNW